jgi:hypothetical protein
MQYIIVLARGLSDKFTREDTRTAELSIESDFMWLKPYWINHCPWLKPRAMIKDIE